MASRIVENRRKEIILARLRIGHSYKTHTYLLKEGRRASMPCYAPFTIKHILVDCVDLAPTRQRFFNVESDVLVRYCKVRVHLPDLINRLVMPSPRALVYYF